MSKPAKLNKAADIKRVLQIQLVVIIVLTFMTYIFFSKQSAQAYILGSLVAWCGHTIFAAHGFKFYGAAAKDKILVSMYFGQLLKWLFTLVAFILLFMLSKDLPVAFILVGFVLTQMSNWLFIVIK